MDYYLRPEYEATIQIAIEVPTEVIEDGETIIVNRTEYIDHAETRTREARFVTYPELCAEYPSVYIPATASAAYLDPLGVDVVQHVERPAIGPNQTAVAGMPVQNEDGQWERTWTVEDWPAEQVAAFLTTQRALLIKQIDTDADAIYVAVVGGRAMEYAQAEADALSYQAAGYTGTVPSSVSSWAGAKGWTERQAADDILTTAANWRNAQAAIRLNRLTKKEQAKNAPEITSLNAIGAAWTGFAAYIRNALGV